MSVEIYFFSGGFNDAKVANTARTTSVQQQVGVLDVTVNDTHLRVQVGQNPRNVRQHNNPLNLEGSQIVFSFFLP